MLLPIRKCIFRSDYYTLLYNYASFRLRMIAYVCVMASLAISLAIPALSRFLPPGGVLCASLSYACRVSRVWSPSAPANEGFAGRGVWIVTIAGHPVLPLLVAWLSGRVDACLPCIFAISLDGACHHPCFYRHIFM